MKIAVSGKGGTGKTTISALLCRGLEAAGRDVIAVDADSNANLAYALGVENPEEITPLAEMEELISEKTGAKKGGYGAYFKMNPDVSDIPERFQRSAGGVKLLVMGSVEQGGTGCACPEYVLMRALIAHLLLNSGEDMVIDMEAGLEHLGRGVTEKVDVLLIVVRPDRVSCVTGARIHKLAKDIRIKNIRGLANGVRDGEDRAFLADQVRDFEIMGFLPYSDEVATCEREGRSTFDIPGFRENVTPLIDQIIECDSARQRLGGPQMS